MTTTHQQPEGGRCFTKDQDGQPPRFDGLWFTVPGPAVGKKNMVPVVNGRAVGMRLAEDSRDYMALVRDTARLWAPPEPWPGPVAVEITVHWPPGVRPYTSVPRSVLAETGPSAHAPTAKPDLTNVAKGIEDALNGLVWIDDAQIVDEHLKKVFGDPARAVVTVRRLSQEPAQARFFAASVFRKRRRRPPAGRSPR